jgi:hypothetical protein
MSDTVYRLITVHPSPVKGMAQIDHDTAEKLKVAGWKRYTGTAEAEDGWIKPGTDPKLKHRTSFRVDL